MYYKLLNKTILSSALIALISISGNQAFSQELFNEDKEVELSEPSFDDISFEIEDDIIPLSEDELIVPETEVKVTVSEEKTQKDESASSTEEAKKEEAVKEESEKEESLKEEPAEEEAKKEEAQEVQPQASESDLPAQPAKAETKPADENKKPETIKAPEDSLEDDFIEDFEINFNEEPEAESQDLFEQTSEQDGESLPNAAPKKADAKNLPNVKGALKKDGLGKVQSGGNLKFGDAILVQTNNDLFNQMSDIEKQTTLLSLELKRERIRNEVEAAKAVREKAELEKQAQEEAKKRQDIEWKNQQQIMLTKAQEDLKQKEIELEKVKQSKALTAYMNSMLEQKQLWIAENGKLYDEIRDLKETNSTLRASYKKDLSDVETQSEKLLKGAETARNNYERAIASLTAQNAQLRKRIESMEKAAKNNPNPFAGKSGNNQISTSADALIRPINIAKEYAIMEITGQGGELFVKLINKDGDSFVAKTGTVLNTGHMIEEITPNYVQFDRNGLKDFLYTATSALSAEPNKISDEDAPLTQARAQARPRASLISDDGLPSVGNSMFVK